MRLVVVESPYHGNWWHRMMNRHYARLAVRDCIVRGEAPIASHLLLTQPGVLRDHIPAEHQMGIEAGHAWIAVADAVVVYADYGVSSGMQMGIKAARAANIIVHYRKILGPISDDERDILHHGGAAL